MSNGNEQKVDDYKSFLPWKQEIASAVEKEYLRDAHLGQVYLENSDLKLVTEVAIVTGRPLLLRGEPGSGKSSLAPFIARNLNWKYYEFNVTGRTEAKELLWRFDALRRLRDAQTKEGNLDLSQYITPGVLWWAFNYKKAFEFIRRDKDKIPFSDINSERNDIGSVVLIDEIDKADPNVPNDLLEVIGVNSFTIDETGEIIKRPKSSFKINPIKPVDYGNLLIVITTNEERDLPPAFLRRCIVYNLENEPETKDRLVQRWSKIARLHFDKNIKLHSDGGQMIKELAGKCFDLREEAVNDIRKSPSVAEFLDAVETCLRLNIDIESNNWKQIKQSVLLKRQL